MLHWFDYLIIILPVVFVLFMGYYVRRYIQSVPDFISAGRLCGRYLISVGDVANALSIITLLSYVEIHYKTGFALSFWNGLLMPISIFLGLTGYCSYRFRATRAMSIGQFIEMRYSRKLRIFAAALRSLSEILANMIMPALAARFFINFLGLPQKFTLFGITFSTFLVLMIIGIALAISIIMMGGMLAIVITDSIQGLLLYPLLIAFVIFILCKFSWAGEIAEVMCDRGPGESFINPFDLKNLRDFNFLMFGVTVLAVFLHRASWYASGSTVAKSAHEQKIAGLLGSWRNALVATFYVLISVGVITTLNHRHFAPEAKAIRNELVRSVANDVIPDPAIRQKVIEAAAAIPEHTHTFGKDTPLSDKNNLDTPYLETARQVLDTEKQDIGIYAQFRALYKQLMTTVTLRNILPPGMIGLFVLMMILAMVSTDDSRVYSASVTITQDVILPLRKRPFTPKQQLWVIRLVALGIGIFFVIGSYFMAQLDYITLFVTIMTSMWMGGCGPVLIFGLYSRFGTTAGAWCSLVSGMILSLSGVILQRNWADIIYPWLATHGMVDKIGAFLTTISKPFHPYIIWEMRPDKFPINSYEIYLMTMIVSLILYIVVSRLTMKTPFNLDKMLHRGIYSEAGKPESKFHWTPQNILRSMLGITNEYSRGDKMIAWGMFCYSFIYQFLFFFVAVVIWNTFSRWPLHWWSNYYCIYLLIVPAAISAITTVWFGIGGIKDIRQLFTDLKHRKINLLDDGRVEGNVSLADKMELDAKEAQQKKS